MRALLIWNHQDSACAEIPIMIVKDLIIERRKCIDRFEAAVCKAERDDTFAVFTVCVEWRNCGSSAISSDQKHSSARCSVIDRETCAGCPNARPRPVGRKT